MVEKIKSLEEVSERINETLGVPKEFSPKNKFYVAGYRGRGITLENQKISADLSFPGTKQPLSFGHFKSKQGYNKRYENSKNYANHYGEYIAYIILKQLEKSACKVDLGTLVIKHPYSGKEIPVDGILSHFQLSQEEVFLPISTYIQDYKKTHSEKYKDLTERGRTSSDKNYTNVEVILETINSLFKKRGRAADIPKIRKQFFDMCIFDVMFANRDRHDENFGLKANQTTGEVSFYPLFDNEQILGMQEERKNVVKYLTNPKEYEKFKKSYLTTCIGIPGKTQHISAKELLTYLLEHYYDETMDSIQDIGRYQLSDLEKVMDVCEGLSPEHKEFAKKIFLERQKEISEVVQQFKEKHKNGDLDEPSL